jgi:hypothetical protein
MPMGGSTGVVWATAEPQPTRSAARAAIEMRVIDLLTFKNGGGVVATSTQR